MKITITIEAESGIDLRENLFALLNAYDGNWNAPGFIGKTLGGDPHMPDAFEQAGNVVTAEGEFEVANEKPEPEPEPAQKPRRAHRATKQAAKPAPAPEPEEQVEVVEEDVLGDEEPDMGLLGKGNGASDAVANEKLKTTVIANLADLFAAGKVKVVRHVLEKYGNGAKSFPEIDAAQFPAIRDAIAKGETS